ncbi:hypothetical protein ACB092_12G094100 [Castanea dentata]
MATEERYKTKGAYIILEPPNFDNQKFLTFEVVTPRSKVLIVRQDMKMKLRTIIAFQCAQQVSGQDTLLKLAGIHLPLILES